MLRFVRTSAMVLNALWLGVPFTLGFIVAPYLFALAAQKSAVVPHTGVAAELIGPLLSLADLISMAAAITLLGALCILRHWGERVTGSRIYLAELMVALAGACAAINYWWFAPQVKAVKAQLAEKYGAYHLSDKADPLYLQFGGLHQTSTIFFVLGMVAVMMCLICQTQIKSRKQHVS
jgi:hypothetical protein